MRSLLEEIGYREPTSTVIHMDNQSAMQVAKNPEHHSRMKHLDLSYYWLRDEVERGTIGIKYIPTDDMVADLLTKPLTKQKVLLSCCMLGLEK